MMRHLRFWVNRIGLEGEFLRKEIPVNTREKLYLNFLIQNVKLDGDKTLVKLTPEGNALWKQA